MRLNLSTKIIGVAIFLSALLFISLSMFYISSYKEDMIDTYVEKGKTIITSLDVGIETKADMENDEKVLSNMYKYIWLDSEIIEICFIEKIEDDMIIKVSNNPKKIMQDADFDSLDVFLNDFLLDKIVIKNSKEVLRLISPVHVSGQILGAYQLDISLENVDKKINEKLKNTIILFLILLIIFITVLFVFIKSIVIKKISMIGNAVKEMTKGELNTIIQLKSKDEIGDLAKSLEMMRKQLKILKEGLESQVKEKTKELKRFNIKLERTIDDRTKELNKKSRELENLNLNLASEIEKKTREIQEKLKKEAKSKKAISYILKRAKRTNVELEKSKKELEIKSKEIEKKSEELQEANKHLLEAEKRLSVFNEELETNIKRRTTEIEEEKNKVDELLKQKTEFVNQLSHDIRTPLTPLTAMTAVLKKRTTDKDDKKRLEIIERNVEYLQMLVEDTLKLAKLDLGKIDVNLAKMNLYELVKESIELNNVVLQKNKIKTENKISKNIETRWDKLEIKEIIENLIMNSTKFIPKGGRLIFNAKKQKDCVVFSVTDTGIGMSEETALHVFDEFFKADESRHIHSSGLGLSICKRIVEKHEGKIWVESKGIGKGTTFFIKIPIDPSNIKNNNTRDIGDIANKNIISINKNQSIKNAAKLMNHNKVGSLIVFERKKPIGFLTERDILFNSINNRIYKLKVKDIMSKKVVSIDKNKTIREGGILLYKKKIKYLTVTSNGNIIGVASINDFNNNLSRLIRMKKTFLKKKLKISAREIMQRKVCTTSKNILLKDAIKKMIKEKSSYIILTENNKVSGIFTERDIVRNVTSYGLNISSMKLSEIVTKNPITAKIDDTIYWICSTFISNHIRRIPIVEDKRLVGIISLREFVWKGKNLFTK